MSNEQQFLIQCLRDHLNSVSTIPQCELDWNEVLRLARSHELTAILRLQCKASIPKALWSEFDRYYMAAVYLYSKRNRVLNDFMEGLKDITAFIVKGICIARLYPVPALRTMGDCDIIVMPGYMTKAVEIAKDKGFQYSFKEHHTCILEKAGITIELHDALTKNDEFANSYQSAFFNDFSQYVHGNKLDWDFHFLFLLMHLRRHLVLEGAGVRQFYDLAVTIHQITELRWDWIKAELNELGMSKFAFACFSLIEDWFGITAPIDYERLDRESIQYVSDKILDNGVFGFEVSENRRNAARMELIEKKGPLWMRRLKVLLEKVFPTYTKMIEFPGCSFLEGKPILLPLAWIRRIMYILIDRSHPGRKHSLRNVFISASDLQSRELFCDTMGLWSDM